MKRIPLSLRLPVIALCLSVAGHAHAATQGSLSSTSSQGSATITVTKSVQARISDISDMTLPNWSIGDGDVTLYSNVCVYSSTQSYKVTATGSGVANIFTLANGSDLIAYSVTWNSGGAGNIGNTGTALLPNIQSTSFSNATNSSSNCSGGGLANDTARVVVTITQAAMEAAPSSNSAYSGTLTMTVAPY